MATYRRKKTDPTYMRKVGDPHIVMYNPAFSGKANYITGWSFDDLLPRGGNPDDIRPPDIIRPPALGGQNINAVREKEKKQSAARAKAKQEEARIEVREKIEEEEAAQIANTEIPLDEEKVPDESPENWRNWSKLKLIKYAKDSLGLDVRPNTGREKVIVKIEEAQHYVEKVE